MQFLDPVLDFATLAVDLFVDPLRALLEVGNDEARVVFGLLAVGPHDLGFDEDAAFSPRSWLRSRCARSCRCAARACGLGAWPAWPYASTPHSWPSPPHTRLLARHPETPATGDARIRHRDERECTLREESNGSTASVCAKSPPHRLPPSRCRDATRQRTDTVPPRH